MKVRYSHPHLPDGYEIAVTGLNAVLKNNEDVEVDDEVIDEYEQRTGKNFKEDVLKYEAFGGKGPPKQAETKPVDQTLTKESEGEN